MRPGLGAALAAGALALGLAAWTPAVHSATASAALAPPELSKPFNTRSEWRLVATQGPPTTDAGDNPAPGALRLCLQRAPAGACVAMQPPDPAYAAWDPHYLDGAFPVYPRGRSAAPLLLIITGSLFAGDGDQVIVTQLFKYDRASDMFERVFARAVGHNNNQAVRFVDSGPLMGDVIVDEPTEDAPFGYWIEVSKPSSAYVYKEVLRYRSATHYGDNNPLSVIDSEMANIEQRLGVWRAGQPLPLPVGRACPKPHLIGMELWCS